LFLLNVVGFTVAGSLLMFVVFIRQYKWWKAILLSVIITFICFFVFKVLFSVPLPVNMFGF
jgi:phosphotransferase system  glucose/maltose/N-acetylglucosamine-specific IIC component